MADNQIPSATLNRSQESNAKTSNSQHTTANINDLSHWFQKYGANSDILLKNNSQTFIDNNGIKRYLDTWKIYNDAKGDLETYKGVKELYLKTGCIHKRIRCQSIKEISKAEDKNLNQNFNSEPNIPAILISETIQTHFLNDWQKLWSYFEQDKEDEIAVQAPLFRLFVEFYFHKRTALAMLIACIINATIDILLPILFPGVDSLFIIVYRLFSIAVNYGAYLTCSYLFTGKFGAGQTSIPLENVPTKIEIPKRNTSYFNHWGSTFKQIASSNYAECKYLFLELFGIQKNQLLDKKKSLSYYDLMNISLKFLVRHNRINMKQIKFNRLTYRMALVFTFFGFPIYIFFNNYFNLYTSIPAICSDGLKNTFCQYISFYLVTSFGGFTYFLQNVIFGGSILVSLIGLAYGCEISYQLTNSWIRKFATLRRIKKDGLCAILPFEKLKLQSDVNEKDRKQPQTETDHNINSISFENIIQFNEINSNENIKWSKIDKTLLNENISDNLTQDAVENYLFIKNYLLEADKIWSPMLIWLFVLMLYVIIGSITYMLLYGQLITDYLKFRILLVSIIRTFVFLFYPITSISHANSYIFELRNAFINSSGYDFSILGGRSKWIKFIDSCPIVWTFYGVWITWDRLSGLTCTSLAGVVAYLITSFQNVSE